jgi:uncharacterized protein with HEPN domain
MNRRCRELLDDLLAAAEFILEITESVDWTYSTADRLHRTSIERNFEILGIALNRLEQEDEHLASTIEERREIIGFRNRIAHGYERDLDAAIIDNVIRNHLPILIAEVTALLEENA